MTNLLNKHRRLRQNLGTLLRPLDFESCLLFCNHLLRAFRGETCAPAVQNLLTEGRVPPGRFLVHLAARECILHCLGTSQRSMGTEEMSRLMGILWEIYDQDPAMASPDWTTTDPTGGLMRFLTIQRPTLANPLQACGLAMALFTNEVGRGIEETADIPALMESCLGMPAPTFMRAGLVAFATSQARHRGISLSGTFTTKQVLSHAGVFGGDLAAHWSTFLSLTSASPWQFRKLTRGARTQSAPETLELFQFNMLKQYPAVRLEEERYIVVDPDFMLARTTLGIYYDGLDKIGSRDFAPAFGYRFAHVTGELIRRICGEERVWSDTRVPTVLRSQAPSRLADHAILGGSSVVLVECKGLNANTQLLGQGLPNDVQAIVKRVADAVVQLADHARSIGAGEWSCHGLPAAACVGVLVTFGHVPLAHSSLVRIKIDETLRVLNLKPLPYLVLSLDEFDTFLRLVELGHAPDDIVSRSSATTQLAFPEPYLDEVKSDAASSVTRHRGKASLDALAHDLQTHLGSRAE